MNMKLSSHLQLELSKQYERNAFLTIKYKGRDVAFKTDAEGNPISLFIGKETENGKIKGERYVRTLKKDIKGMIIKDHWELKGKAT